MEFIAVYWWVWLIGLLICGAYGLFKWVMGFFGTAGAVLKMTSLTIEGVQTASDKETTTGEKLNKMKDRTIEEAVNEGVSRVKGFGLAALALGSAWVFGLLFVLSIILHVIDYIKA